MPIRFYDIDTTHDGTLQADETSRFFKLAVENNRVLALNHLLGEAKLELAEIAGPDGAIKDSQGKGSENEIKELHAYAGFYDFVSKHRDKDSAIDYEQAINGSLVQGEVGRIISELAARQEEMAAPGKLNAFLKDNGVSAKSALNQKITALFANAAADYEEAEKTSQAYAGKTVADIFAARDQLVSVSSEEDRLYKIFMDIAGPSGKIDTPAKLARLLRNYKGKNTAPQESMKSAPEIVDVRPGTLWDRQTVVTFSKSGQRLDAIDIKMISPDKFDFKPLGYFYEVYKTAYFAQF